MDAFEKIVKDLCLSEAEKEKLKEDFEFNQRAEQEEYDLIIAMHGGCQNGRRNL